MMIRSKPDALETAVSSQEAALSNKLDALETALSSQEAKLDGLSHNLTELQGTVGFIKAENKVSSHQFILVIYFQEQKSLRSFKGGVILDNPERTLTGTGLITRMGLVTRIRSSGLEMITFIS